MADSTTYDVVLLVEQALSPGDAGQVRSLHEGIEDPVRYHVLMPIEDAAGAIEAAMGTLAGHDLVPGPSMTMRDIDLEAIQEESRREALAQLDGTLAALRATGADAQGELVVDPIDALASKVTEVGGAEVIILTRPHVVAEFFHVDWTSQARRRIGVPILHLLEHENFDEQAGGGEGVTGL